MRASQGMTVLLIAGWGSGGDESWSAVRPALAQQARVCTYDRPGTGTSDTPAATSFVLRQEDIQSLPGFEEAFDVAVAQIRIADLEKRTGLDSVACGISTISPRVVRQGRFKCRLRQERAGR